MYCHPSCAARPARPENVSFHADRSAAEAAGFRPCKRCKPDQPPRAEREAALVADACRSIEQAEEPPALDQLAAAAGLSPFHFHRLFRRIAGVTPKAYADARRADRVQSGLRAGDSVTEAMYDAGFNSSGRFYAAAANMLGMAPSIFRAGGAGETIRYATGHSTLGPVLVAATERGVCAILLGEDTAALQSRFPRAQLEAAEAGFGDWVAQVVAHVDAPRDSFTLPLDIQGTAFQRRVWEVLRSIPPAPPAAMPRSPRNSATRKPCVPWPAPAPPTNSPSSSPATASSAPTARCRAIAGASSANAPCWIGRPRAARTRAVHPSTKPSRAPLAKPMQSRVAHTIDTPRHSPSG